MSDERIDEQIAEATAELERLNEEAERTLAAESQSTDLVPVTQSAVDARQALAETRARATKIRNEVQAQAKRLGELQRRKAEAMERRMKRELERMERHLAPLQEQLARLEEAVWTVNLYLGRDEEIVRLYNGDPAGAEEPVVVRQLVLAMDQECAVAAEEGGIDSLNHEKFDEWLQEDWAHVEQVIPEEKAVVACVPRYGYKRYEDPRKTADAAEGNKQTYFLVRNGRQVYRTWTDFRVGRTLVPKRDEFTGYFMQRTASWERRDNPDLAEYVAMEPGSEQWLKAEKQAGHRQRDYMRVALILEGLLHRTTVFHPLPEGGISFTDLRFHEAGTVRFVMDAERTLGSGREPFKDWLRRLNAQLRPGMRVVGNFQSQGWYEARREDGVKRIRGAGGGIPDTGAIYRIEDRERDGALIIRYHPEGTRLVPDGETPYPGKPGYVYRYKQEGHKRRKSALLYPEDDFIIPFDLVTVEDCRAYLDSRIERSSYVSMFPVLKGVIRAKLAEEKVEAPFRQMLAGVLARDCGVSVEQAEQDVPDLVRWYKLSNRIHRPILLDVGADVRLPEGVDWDDVDLVSQDPHAEDAAKPVRLITAEYKRRLRDRERGHSGERLDELKAAHPDALVIARLRSGPYLVLTPEDDRNVHVRERHYYARTGELKDDKRWVLPGTRPSRWIMLHESERWREWDLAATAAEHLTGPELEGLLEQVREKYDGDDLLAVCTRVGHDDDYSWSEPMPGHLFAEAWLIGQTYHGELQAVAHTQRWERKRGEVRLLKGDDHAYSYDRRGRPWREAADPHGRKRERVFYESDDAWRRLRDRIARRKAAEDRRTRTTEQRRDLVEAAMRSIEVQWLQPRYEQVWQRFLEDYADADLWEGHRKQHTDLLPEFPYASSFREDRPPWVRALWALVKAGQEPWGMTVAEAQRLAHEDPRFKMEYDDFNELTIWEPTGSGSGSRRGVGTRKPEDVELVPPPAEIADLVFTEGVELVEPWAEVLAEREAEEPDDDDFCENCGAELSDDRRQRGWSFCEKCEPERDFDAEVDALPDDSHALPRGTDA